MSCDLVSTAHSLREGWTVSGESTTKEDFLADMFGKTKQIGQEYCFDMAISWREDHKPCSCAWMMAACCGVARAVIAAGVRAWQTFLVAGSVLAAEGLHVATVARAGRQ